MLTRDFTPQKKLVCLTVFFLLMFLSVSSSAKPIRVMTLGDSITAGLALDNYRLSLGTQTRSVGCDVSLVGASSTLPPDALPPFPSRYAAVWGIQALQVDQLFINSWMQDAKPDVVLMHLGTNDSWAGGRPATDTIVSLGGIIDKMRLNNPHVKIFIAQLIGTSLDFNPVIEKLNALIPGLAAQKTTPQSPVVVVNQSSYFNPAVDTYDGVHPTVAGNVKMASKWFDAMVVHGICPAGPKLVNAVLNKPMVASPSPWGSGSPEQAGDGNVQYGGWSSVVIDNVPQILEVDLKGAYSLTYFELGHYFVFPDVENPFNTLAYRIQTSMDKSTWSTVVTVANNYAGQATHAIVPTNARYLRLVVDPPFYANQLTVREFRAMGVPQY
ncbi:GDSL-type esterase/lipase family protein [Iodobacter arcticus]|uniref:GDSL-type esterase/lipase family protein n=1 Tax=Iodobacter arcticus TaxID=590593 RepID=A0ABW2R0Y3_9NEIS